MGREGEKEEKKKEKERNLPVKPGTSQLGKVAGPVST